MQSALKAARIDKNAFISTGIWAGTSLTGGSEFNAVPAATGRSRQHRSRSTWGLVSRSIGSISSLVPGIELSRDFKRAKVPGNPMKSPFCFGVFWGVIFKKNLFSQVESRIT